MKENTRSLDIMRKRLINFILTTRTDSLIEYIDTFACFHLDVINIDESLFTLIKNDGVNSVYSIDEEFFKQDHDLFWLHELKTMFVSWIMKLEKDKLKLLYVYLIEV